MHDVCIGGIIFMCGIFGLINYGSDSYDKSSAFRKAAHHLLKASESRGKDASGICVLTDEKASVYKEAFKGSKLVRTPGYSEVIKNISCNKNFKAMLGHTRQKTKGTQSLNVNNHPIIANKVIGVHNGIVVNDDSLFSKYSDCINRLGEVDSEIIFRLINYHIATNKTIVEAVKLAHKEMSGSYACAFIHTDMPRYLTLFSNAQSYSNAILYIFKNVKSMAFASSRHILNKSLDHSKWLNPAHTSKSIDITMGGVRIDLETGKILKFDLDDDCTDTWFRRGKLKDKLKLKKLKEKNNKSQFFSCGICEDGYEMVPGYGMCSDCAVSGY